MFLSMMIRRSCLLWLFLFAGPWRFLPRSQLRSAIPKAGTARRVTPVSQWPTGPRRPWHPGGDRRGRRRPGRAARRSRASYPRQLLKLHGIEGLWNVFVQGGKQMFRNIPDDYRTEMDALVKSSQVDRDAIVTGNTLFDLKKIFACSALLVEADRSATGGPLLGRNLDYPSLGYVHHYSLVTVYRPKGKHAFVSVGFPGLVGCLSGMNDAGLAVAILEVFEVKQGEAHFDVEGMPYATLLPPVLEECTTIDEAKKLLEGMRRTRPRQPGRRRPQGRRRLRGDAGAGRGRPADSGVAGLHQPLLHPAAQAGRARRHQPTLRPVRCAGEAGRETRKLTPDDLRKQLDDDQPRHADAADDGLRAGEPAPAPEYRLAARVGRAAQALTCAAVQGQVMPLNVCLAAVGRTAVL